MTSIRKRAPQASSPIVRRVMQANVGRSTAIEARLQRELFLAGLRFSVNVNVVRGVRVKADFVFRMQKVCVFVDGCFWHGCKLHFRLPKTNSEWWKEKVEDNRRRDKDKTRLLKKRGWIVIRLWEHELSDGSIERAVSKVIHAIHGATPNGP